MLNEKIVGQKGQSSFEMLTIALVLMGLTIFILTNYFSLSDSLTALGIMKIETIKELNEQKELYFIERITFKEFTNEPERIDFQIITNNPEDLNQSDLDFANAIAIISNNTANIYRARVNNQLFSISRNGAITSERTRTLIHKATAR